MLVRIRMLAARAGSTFHLRAGAVVEVEATLAAAWVASGSAEPWPGDRPLEHGPDAAIRVTSETAVRPRARGRR